MVPDSPGANVIVSPLAVRAAVARSDPESALLRLVTIQEPASAGAHVAANRTHAPREVRQAFCVWHGHRCQDIAPVPRWTSEAISECGGSGRDGDNHSLSHRTEGCRHTYLCA